jgi:hypothetical protein
VFFQNVPVMYSPAWKEFRRLARLAATGIPTLEYGDRYGIVCPGAGDVQDWLALLFLEKETCSEKLDEFMILDDPAKASFEAVRRIIDQSSSTQSQNPSQTVERRTTNPKAIPAGISDDFQGELKVLALLVKYPGWSDTELAKTAGISRTSLYRMERFKGAKAAMKHQGRFNLRQRQSKQQNDQLD